MIAATTKSPYDAEDPGCALGVVGTTTVGTEQVLP